MAEHLEHTLAEANGLPHEEVVLPREPAAEAVEAPAEAAVNGATEEGGPSRHAEAGRKGARRFHELVRLGRLYEQEHGLKRGRQRLKQLVEQGRLYEQEHGLTPKPRTGRGPRVSGEQALRRLLDVLARIVKPAYRPHLARLAQALEGVTGVALEPRVETNG